MKVCRMCNNSKIKFVCRGSKETNTCEDCSEYRKSKDYCEHGVRYHDCHCCIDPIVRRATSMVHSSKISDKKANRDCDLDFEFTMNMICDNPKCYYCDVSLDYENSYNDEFCTIDRIDNNIGHVRFNCVIACRKCNCYNYKFLTEKYKKLMPHLLN